MNAPEPWAYRQFSANRRRDEADVRIHIPRGKLGRTQKIAVVALLLASDDSSFVSGVELSVDGTLSAI